MKVRIVDLRPDDEKRILQAAQLLVDGFREHAPAAWSDIDSAIEEVRESFAKDRISRIALDENGDVAGWIGGIRQYDGHVWELHPLVVREDCRRSGIGRALVADLESIVQDRGATTLWLGTDDENDRTSLGGLDLYPDVLRHARGIRNLNRHPYEFYEKCGFAIVGILPDANGFGKPDIYMAKRVVRWAARAGPCS